jgi:hypothetical protein
MKITALMLAVAFVLLAHHSVLGQQRSESAAAQRLDDSDSWSMLNPQQRNLHGAGKPSTRVVAATNLKILELSTLGKAPDDWLEQKFGKAHQVARGDGGDSRTQYCYRSTGPENIYLISEAGEVELGFYLLADPRPWKGQELCIPSHLVTKSLATESGLRLGLTREQVKAILGDPVAETADTLGYLFEIEVPTEPDALNAFLKHNPSYSIKDIARDFPTHYGLSVDITAKFANGRLTYLYVDRSEID